MVVEMGKNKSPKPTDPKKISAATTGSNISTSIANAYLNSDNMSGPFGSSTKTQTGTKTVTDPYTGKTYEVPVFTTNVTLDPAQQAILDQRNQAGLTSTTKANELLSQYSSQPTRLGNAEVEARLFDLGRGRLDPVMARRDESLRTRLANQGIQVGTEAYNREMDLLRQGENDAYNQLLLTGRQQAVNEMLAEDNQNLNRISTLLGNGSVQQPQMLGGGGGGQIPFTDNASMIANNDASRMSAWQQKQQSMGGLFSTIGGIAGAVLSDERAKDDKKKIGETKDGMGIYSFRYKGSPQKQIGLMAQEVEKKKPKAVMTGPDGLKRVNYERALR